MGRTQRLLSGLALVAALALAPSASAQDPGPPYTDWNPGWEGFPSNAHRSARAECRNGSTECIERTIGEMYRRFHTVVPRCDGNAVFSITYIRVTEDIRRAVAEGFYPDVPWLEVQDATFARTYFLAYDNYLAGRTDLVPPAWRVAFDAGRDETVKGIGNLLLSMNAHINRDFPFILYHSGLADPDGTSRKPQHDSYNPRLRALYKPVIDEITRRFDPSTDDYDIPGTTADDDALFQVLVAWRETAWQNAQRLAAAHTDAERHQVADSIEAYALAQAGLIFAGSAYAPGESTAARDAQCKEHGGQHPHYRRGADAARFAGAPAKLLNGQLRIPAHCPDGPGPCMGVASAAGHRKRFALKPRETATIAVRVGPGFDRPQVEARLRSLLGPGDQFTKKRTLRPG
jgi:hypothetical protein